MNIYGYWQKDTTRYSGRMRKNAGLYPCLPQDVVCGGGVLVREDRLGYEGKGCNFVGRIIQAGGDRQTPPCRHLEGVRHDFTSPFSTPNKKLKVFHMEQNG